MGDPRDPRRWRKLLSIPEVEFVSFLPRLTLSALGQSYFGFQFQRWNSLAFYPARPIRLQQAYPPDFQFQRWNSLAFYDIRKERREKCQQFELSIPEVEFVSFLRWHLIIGMACEWNRAFQFQRWNSLAFY